MWWWWFNKGKRKELWDENIQWPIGDIEAANKIRNICRSAADGSETADGSADRLNSTKNKYETERYERAAKATMEIAIKISDDLLRDSAVQNWGQRPSWSAWPAPPALLAHLAVCVVSAPPSPPCRRPLGTWRVW